MLAKFARENRFGMAAYGRFQPLTVSLKQTFERPVSGKAAAQAQCEEWVRTCRSPSSTHPGLNSLPKVDNSETTDSVVTNRIACTHKQRVKLSSCGNLA